MNAELSNEQIRSFQEDGFAIIDDILNPEELETWRATFDDAVAQANRNDQFIPLKEGQTFDPVFKQRFNLWRYHRGMRDLLFNPALGRMLATLAGVDGIRLYTDQALIKPPWGNPTSWHVDNPSYSFSSKNGLNLWLALDDATHQNGCLYVLPGTHKKASLTPGRGTGARLSNIATMFDSYPEWREIEAVAVTMKAGSCSCLNGLLAHAAGPNMTPYPRRALTCLFMPDGSTFSGRKGYFTKEYAASLEVGDLLDDDEVTPLIYKHCLKRE